MDRGQFLQDDRSTFGLRSNSINATLSNTERDRRRLLPDSVNIPSNRVLKVFAKTYGSNGTSDPTQARRTSRPSG